MNLKMLPLILLLDSMDPDSSSDSEDEESVSEDSKSSDDEEAVLRHSQSTKKFLIHWVATNNVERVKSLFDTLPCYHVTDNQKNSLLQVAIYNDRKEVFDYLLSLDGFPLETRNSLDHTALETAITQNIMSKPLRTSHKYFAKELLRKGAQLYPDALFHAITDLWDPELSELLLERGADPNVKVDPIWDGQTCLHFLFNSDPIEIEFEYLLLSNGADPLVEDEYGTSSLEKLLTASKERKAIWRDYLIDEHSRLRVHLNVLIDLAMDDWKFFYWVIDYVGEVVADYSRESYWTDLVCFQDGHFKEMEDKLWFFWGLILLTNEDFDTFCASVESGSVLFSPQLSIDNFSDFVEDYFDCSFFDFVSNLNSNLFFKCLLLFSIEESTAVEIVCYLLLNGMNFNQLDLQMVYKKYGYGELFKIMLNMDFHMHHTEYANEYVVHYSDHARFKVAKFIMPMFIYNVCNFDVETYLQAPEEHSEDHIEELLHYFVHPKLTRYCEQSSREDLQVKVKRFPKVPLLKQLARDASRKFLLDKFSITKTRQFYTCVKALPISSVYKKIITYETRLY